MAFTPKAEDRIAASVLFTENLSKSAPTRPSKKIHRNSQRLVKLTTQLTNAKVWEAAEVYLDETGEPVEIEEGVSFSGDVIVFTVTNASVGDLILVQPKFRPDGTVFWVGGASGGGGGGSTRVLVQNKTLVTGAGGGDWELLNADDKGTFADEAALLAAHAAPTDNMYAKTTDTGTYWIASGVFWRDTGSATKTGAGIEGVWIAQHTAAVPMQVTCDVGALLFLDLFNGAYYANDGFATWRGETQA